MPRLLVALLAPLVLLLAGCTDPDEIFGARLEPTWRVVDVITPADCPALDLERPCMLVELEATRDNPYGHWDAVAPRGPDAQVRSMGQPGNATPAGAFLRLMIESIPPAGLSHLKFEPFMSDREMRVDLDRPARVASVDPWDVRDLRVSDDPLTCWRHEGMVCHRVTARFVPAWTIGFSPSARVRDAIGSDGGRYDDVAYELGTAPPRDEIRSIFRLPAGVEVAALDLEWSRERRTVVPVAPLPPPAPEQGKVTTRLVDAVEHDECDEARFGWTCVRFTLELANGLDDALGVGSATLRSERGIRAGVELEGPDRVAAGHTAVLHGESVMTSPRAELTFLGDELPPVAIVLGEAISDEPFVAADATDGRIRLETFAFTQDCATPPCVRAELRVQRAASGSLEWPVMVDALGGVRGPMARPSAGFDAEVDVRYGLTYAWRGEGTPRFFTFEDRELAVGAWTPLGIGFPNMAVPPRPWALELELVGQASEVEENDLAARTLDVRVRSHAAMRTWLSGWWVPHGEDAFTLEGQEWNVTMSDGSRWQLSLDNVTAVEPGGEAIVRLAMRTPGDVRPVAVWVGGVELAIDGTPPPRMSLQGPASELQGVRVERLAEGLALVHVDHAVAAGDMIGGGWLELRTHDGGRYHPSDGAGPQVLWPGEAASFHTHFVVPAWARPIGLSWDGENETTVDVDALDPPPAGPVEVWRRAACAEDALCLRIGFTSAVQEDFFTRLRVEVKTTSGRVYYATPALVVEEFQEGTWAIVDLEIPRGEVPATLREFHLRADPIEFPPLSAWRAA